MQDQKLASIERHESRARAKMIYETIKSKLESSLRGKFVAIEVETGEYFTGDTLLDAAEKARAKHPDKIFHFFRVGSPTVYVWR